MAKKASNKSGLGYDDRQDATQTVNPTYTRYEPPVAKSYRAENIDDWVVESKEEEPRKEEGGYGGLFVTGGGE